MRRELNQSEALRVSGGFDHLPGPRFAPPPLPDQWLVKEWIRQLKEQSQQENYEDWTTPPGH